MALVPHFRIQARAERVVTSSSAPGLAGDGSSSVRRARLEGIRTRSVSFPSAFSQGLFKVRCAGQYVMLERSEASLPGWALRLFASLKD